jgi:hypothetical protein
MVVIGIMNGEGVETCWFWRASINRTGMARQVSVAKEFHASIERGFFREDSFSFIQQFIN